MNCKQCNGECIKYGRRRNGTQIYRCKNCRRCQQATYKNKAWAYKDLSQVLMLHLINGVGIRSTARLLGISKGTVIAGLLRIPSSPQAVENLIPGDTYEVDELRTFVGSKQNECWIIVVFSRLQSRAVRVAVGPRNKRNIEMLLRPVMVSEPRRIYTDGFLVYSLLLPASLHRVSSFGTSRLERFHLTLRTHLKRLARRSICFTRSETMLRKSAELYLKSVA